MSGHHHHHSSSGRLGLAFFLNLAFTIIEFIGGALTNSMAIMADAVHDLGDTLAIGLAWTLDRVGRKEADNGFTYGYHRLSLLGALINGAILIIGSLWILSEALPRLINPQMPDAVGMIWLAILGVTVNGFAAYKLSGGKTLNEKVLNWHLLEDVLGWVARAGRQHRAVVRRVAHPGSDALYRLHPLHPDQCPETIEPDNSPVFASRSRRPHCRGDTGQTPGSGTCR